MDETQTFHPQKKYILGLGPGCGPKPKPKPKPKTQKNGRPYPKPNGSVKFHINSFQFKLISIHLLKAHI